MKKFLIVIMALGMMGILAGCGNQNNESISQESEPQTEASADNTSEDMPQTENQETAGDMTVVYFSGTGNTASVAENLAQVLNAPIYEIQPLEPYTEADLDYTVEDCRANKEMRDTAARPELSDTMEDTIAQVESSMVVYIGYPIWDGTAPRIINTFLESCDLSGKTVYTFCTSGGSGIEGSISDLQEAYPNLNIVGGQQFQAGASQDTIREWTDTLQSE